MIKILGIIGGMGPLATTELLKKIVLFTDAQSDQEHLPILIDNNTTIPDRTAYIVGLGENPITYLVESAQRLERMGADYLIMPCNTAHYFYKEIAQSITIPFLNMIEETAKYIAKTYAPEKEIGLLATEGTGNSGIYDEVFRAYNMRILKPSKDTQKFVTEFIYDIKKGKETLDLKDFFETVKDLNNQGANVLILGCTELSVAYDLFKFKGNFVDPLEILALKAIEFAGKKQKNII